MAVFRFPCNVSRIFVLVYQNRKMAANFNKNFSKPQSMHGHSEVSYYAC